MIQAATKHMTPEESRALGRLIVAIFRLVARMGGMGATLTLLGVFTAGFIIYSAPVWWDMIVDGWDTIRDWMGR